MASELLDFVHARKADHKQDGALDTIQQRFLDSIDAEDDLLTEYHNTLSSTCAFSVAPDVWLLELSQRSPPAIDEQSPLAPLHRFFAGRDRGMIGTLAAFGAMLAAGVPEAVVLRRVDEEALASLWGGWCRESWRSVLRKHLESRGYGRDFIDDLVAERASPPAELSIDVEET